MTRVIGIFLAVFGCLLLFSAAEKDKIARSYQESSVRAEAVVVGKQLEAATRNGPRESIFRVWFKLPDAAAGTAVSVASVDPETFEALRVGGPVKVVHVPGKADSIRLESEFQLESGTGERVSGLIVLVAGGVLLWWPAGRKPIQAPDWRQTLLAGWRWVKTAAFLGAVIVASAVLAQLPFVVAAGRHIDANSQQYLGAALLLFLSGLGLMIGSLLLRMKEGQATADAFHLKELKEAARAGTLNQPLWRWRARVALGALLLGLGIAAIFVAVSADFMRVLVLAAIAFVFFKTARALWTA